MHPRYDMYLNARDPLPINYNPFIMFKDTPLKYVRNSILSPSSSSLSPSSSSKDWVACASSYAAATAHFYTLVRSSPLASALLFCIN
jgi:hypothetical protein